MPYAGDYSGGLSVTMKIATSDAGKVIGRGGKKIRELEQAGGGRIKISSAPDENGMKIVDISGRDHEVEATRRLIEDFLRDFNIGDNARKREGFSGGNNHSKPVHNSRGEGYRREDKHQDNDDQWGWHEEEEEDDKDIYGGGSNGRSGGYGSGCGEDVYKSRNVCNSKSRGQDHGDRWDWHEEDEKDFSIGNNDGKRGGFSGGYDHRKPEPNSRSEGYRREDKHQDNDDQWGWHEEEDDKDIYGGASNGRSGGFGSSRGDGVYKSINVCNSKRRGQDHGDRWDWHEEVERDVSGGGCSGRSGGFGSGRGEDVYKSRNIYNSERRGQKNDDRRDWHEEDEKADITSASSGTRRGGSSNRDYRDQDRQHNGDRWGSHEHYDKGTPSSGGHGQAVDEDYETICVISSDAGKIIGRGGSRIRELEADSGCRIQVSRAEGSSGQSQVELIGSKSAISEAKRLIQETGVEIVNGSDHGHGTPSSGVHGQAVDEDNETICVISSDAGKIIGRGGSRIRELETDSGCRIQVSRAEGPNGQIQVELIGSKSAISEAKRLIQEAGVEIVNGSDHGHGTPSSGGHEQAVDEDYETICVISSDAGKIIGRGGSRIRELETDSGCRIQVSRAEGPNGQIQVELIGSKSAISEAKRLIQEAGVEIVNGSDHGHGTPSSGGHEQAVDEDYETICVISSDVGKIIGRGGSRIRELETDSGCRIQVSRAEGPSGQSQVELIGSKSAISEAKRLIQETGVEIVNGSDHGHGTPSSGGHEQAVDEDYETICVISSDAGKIIGRGGSRIRELETDSGCKIKVSRAEGPSGQSQVELIGSKSAISEAKRLIQETGVEIVNGSDHGLGTPSSGGHGQAVDEDNETICVISSDVGKIIGRGGSRIRELETDSGCKIQVSRAEGPSGQSQVELIGSKSAISEAKRLIQETGVEIVNGSDHGLADAPEHSKDEEEYVSELKKRPLIDWNALREKHKEQQKDRLSALPAILKDFYKEETHIKNMPHEEVKQIRKENNNIIVDAPDGESDCVPNPVRTFEDAFKHYPLILEQIKKQNFVKPSPIQCQSWPVLLQGKDLIGVAQTGTGKTLAFLLPALIHIDSQPIPRERRVGPSALILSPTRELAQQIEMEINKINYKGIRSICVYGGGNRTEQLKKVRKGVEIVVATPGRLNDFMMHGQINVKNVTYVVMDEADRMLDLGFELEIKKVMLDIRPDRQTVMTSATWPSEVKKLAEQYMTKPYTVFVGTLDLAAVHSVTQHLEFIDERDKRSMLLDFILNMKEDDKLIVFVGKKMVADDVSSDLAMNNVQCQCIHGDREQCDRETALEEFKNGTVRILVATDVASRGLDVKDITHVLNYDFPSHIEEYVHRIGRTGRAGRSGTSLTFMTRNDWKNAQQLIDIMSEADQNIPDELVAMAERYSAFKERNGDERMGSGFNGRGGGGRGRGGRGRGGQGRRRNDDDVGNFWI